MNIPTREDWGEPKPDELDFISAFKDFFGKTQAEAQVLFADNALAYGEDLYYMKGVVFGYYLQAFKNYLLSEAARGDSGAASYFLSILDFKSTDRPSDLFPYWNDLNPLLEKLATLQGFFEADWSIYGDFRWRIGQIVRRGFPVSFDTSGPERVPSDATLTALSEITRFGGRSLSLEAAVQVFQNSGFNRFSSQTTRADLNEIFGTPQASGGGMHPEYGLIPEWIIYQLPQIRFHFSFEGDAISTVMLLGQMGSQDRVAGLK